MLKITTNWIRKTNPKDAQVTPQHFIDVGHYRDYEATMLKRGYSSELVEVLDLDTDKKAQIDGNKIIFGGTDA